MPEALQRQRWLIITSSTGSGHDMRAYALCEWVQREFGERVQVEVYHALEDGSWLGRFGVWFYNSIQRYAPWLHNIYWFIAEVFGWLNQWGIGIASSVWEQKLTSSRPHLIISMHDSLNRGYFRAARRCLGDDRVRCVTYCGEWSGGFGFSRNWVDPAAHRIYVRRAEVGAYVEDRGYPAEDIRVFCNLLPPRAFDPLMTASERAHFRVSLGLHPERFTVFLATGALGADRHLAFLDAMLPLHDRLQVIVVSGQNARAFERIADWARAHPQLVLAHEGFSRRMHLLMQASDCLVTRGGANTMTEALYFGCPILFHAHHGLMPQERCTLRFLQRAGVGEQIRGARHLASVLEEWILHPEIYAAFRERIQAVACDDKPWMFVRQLALLAEETQGG